MKTAKLADGTEVYCLVRDEAVVLDHHVAGYLTNGIRIADGDVVFDVGANIGVFGLRVVQRHANARVYAFEPVPPIFAVLAENAAHHGDGRLRAMPCGLSRAAATVSLTYFPHSPALSTAHPEMWDDDPGALQRAVKGSLQHPPPSLWWTRWVPGFMHGA
ncbi:MAG TPA: FkbM family methyltransferase, partial [Nannocystis sp.]